MTAIPGHVEQSAVAVILGFEEPGGVVERLAARDEQDRLDGGKGSG
jgi:hypothetical protein